jgi:predicted methyltransferase
VSVILNTLPNFAAPEKLDLVFTAQNYHDMHDKFMGPADLSVVNRQVFKAPEAGRRLPGRRPFGRARLGPARHRDPAPHRLRGREAEVTAAGFIFEGESRVLRDPSDTRKLSVFDPSIRGKTDQFIYKFRKPAGAR